MGIKRIFSEKCRGFNVKAQNLFSDLKENLGIRGLKNLRILIRYDIEGISREEYDQALTTVFSEPPVDEIYEGSFDLSEGETCFAVEFLPGQYDQRADSASQCIQIMAHSGKHKAPPSVKTAEVIVLSGSLSEEDVGRIKEYVINPVDSHEAPLEIPETLSDSVPQPRDIERIAGFSEMNTQELVRIKEEMGLAMSTEDLVLCRDYFKKREHRDPTETEVVLLDTYWSDHCRHTTFMTKLTDIRFKDSVYTDPVKQAYKEYLKSREYVYKDKDKPVCLMDMATIGMKELRKKGLLDDLEESDEINACSISVTPEINGKEEEWLVMFKNETHNHPTEIEPFGGAATCLGGAIRDPLSGRSYVYQAMRVTGAGDPRTPVSETIPGKLPQIKITKEAASGYSSYGNQIGLATGLVKEIYHRDFTAKRMEIGAVVGAAPRENVVRESPCPGDVIVLTGGRTGRDGCGGATGSSKEHTEESLETCGAEVQKGNPPTERKIQRLFRIPEVSRMIKKCNDFGAGGVSVAIGELAPGISVDLDKIPLKYQGLDGTELAISESQERMAVLLERKDMERFINYAEKENLEATCVAEVTSDNRFTMTWRDATIVDISRDFIDTNGALQTSEAEISAPSEKECYFRYAETGVSLDRGIKKAWLDNLSDLNVCSGKGLSEMFDSTVGARSVLMPFSGMYQDTPEEVMAAKLPTESGDSCSTCTLMSYGYNPGLSEWSPFHGGLYAVVLSIARIAASGGLYSDIRLSLQEYFESLKDDAERWGKPVSALLGALKAQREFGVPAIGGKDSMSGTFGDLSVPPVLTSFSVCTAGVSDVISSEFKSSDNSIVLLPCGIDESGMPDFDGLRRSFKTLAQEISKGGILSAYAVDNGGPAAALSKMGFGNRIGFSINIKDPEDLFRPSPGSIVCEVESLSEAESILRGIGGRLLGSTEDSGRFVINSEEIGIDEALERWKAPLNKVFPVSAKPESLNVNDKTYSERSDIKPVSGIAKPRVFIPVFPGTNCEYESADAFSRAGAVPELFVVKNLRPSEVDETLKRMEKTIRGSEIIMLPGGFSAGDEPEGSGKFIQAVFRNPNIADAVTDLIENRKGLILGICNGFQALIKLGLLPYGRMYEIERNSPTLTFNTIGRHVSTVLRTRITSTLSPWFSGVETGDVHSVPVSHGEGRFYADDSAIKELFDKGQVASQYCDFQGDPSMVPEFNPNGSVSAVEGITNSDGRILGKMGHSERIGKRISFNVPGNKDQRIFESGVKYFK